MINSTQIERVKHFTCLVNVISSDGHLRIDKRNRMASFNTLNNITLKSQILKLSKKMKIFFKCYRMGQKLAVPTSNRI